MVILLKPSAATAAVALAFLNINALPIHAFQSPLTKTLRPSRSTTATATSLREHEESNKEVDADVIIIAPPSTAEEWIQQDLEAQPSSDVHLSEGFTPDRRNENAIKIIFSDIDGSLIHYPNELQDHESPRSKQQEQDDETNLILALPPSATGLRGLISSQTLATCRDLRLEKDVKLVLVTGARTSTLLNRLPYLPKADAYCTEAGGRIFYPTDDTGIDCCLEDIGQFTYTPVEYSGANIANGDLKPFGLREDMVWRKRMEVGGAGTEAYVGNEVLSHRCHGEMEDEECLIDYESTDGFPLVEDEVPVSQRKGHLWQYANQLVEREGFVLDTKSYSTCFRVNSKHQTNGNFKALLDGDISHPALHIGKSTNLGCIDFYPAVSGKANCCQYIANELGFNLSTEGVCICDDDNDTEMALACSHSYIPSLTSESMLDTLRQHQSNFTQTFGPGISPTTATEVALQAIYDMT